MNINNADSSARQSYEVYRNNRIDVNVEPQQTTLRTTLHSNNARAALMNLLMERES